MKEKIIIVVLVTLALLNTGWSDSWEAIKQNSGQLKSVRADFTQEKHLKILSRPLVSKGTFIFQTPGSLRWEYESPIKSTLLMHNGRTKKIIQRGNELVEEQGMSLDSMQIILQEITQWLKGRFTENPTFTASLEQDHHILLTPKDQAISKLINRIDLKLSDVPGLMDSVTIYEGPDSFTKLTFNNAELNQQMNTSLFTEK